MKYQLSTHAREELQRRKIPDEMLDAVMAAPEQKVPGHGGIICFQSRVEISGRQYLLRAMVNDSTVPPTVVTIYRTSKIAKYWRTP